MLSEQDFEACRRMINPLLRGLFTMACVIAPMSIGGLLCTWLFVPDAAATITQVRKDAREAIHGLAFPWRPFPLDVLFTAAHSGVVPVTKRRFVM